MHPKKLAKQIQIDVRTSVTFNQGQRPLTEIPEDLLQRSRAAKAAKLGLAAPEDSNAPAAASVAADTSAASSPSSLPTPSKTAQPSADLPYLDPEPEPPRPEPAYVSRAKSRKKIPLWAMPVVASLPVWAWGFAGTLQQPPSEDVLLIESAALYTDKGCSGCHGASGGGGSGYQLSGGAVLETFPDPIDQMIHVARGSSEISDQEYGAPRADGSRRKAGATGSIMPAQKDSLSQAELEMIIFHERAILSGEDTTQPEYQEWMEHMREAYESGDETPIDLNLLLACANPEATPGATNNPTEECPGPSAPETT